MDSGPRPRANNKVDLFFGPDLWHAVQEIIVDTDDAQGRGLERMATIRWRHEVMSIFAMMRLWETLREGVA